GYPQPYPMYAYPVAQPRTNPAAITALILSIVAFPFLLCYGIVGALLGVAGAIVGHVARNQIRDRGEGGGGMALAGIICGWIAFGLGVAGLVLFVWGIAQLSHLQPDPYPYPS